MYVSELKLKNVRQFEDRTFKFQPGFNLLVGVNGAGKTTLLRSLLAVISNTKQTRQRYALTDEDVRLHSTILHVSSQLSSRTDRSSRFYEYSRRLGHRAIRDTIKDAPLVLAYASNEATCSSFIGRRVRRYVGKTDIRSASEEEWLYHQQSTSSHTRPLAPNFGRSENIRAFVHQVLSTFSPRFRNFIWSFEPYDCTIHPPKDKWKAPADDLRLRRSFKNAIMRHLLETRNTLAGIDKPSVTVDSKGYIIDANIRKSIVPEFSSLLSRLDAGSKSIELYDRCSVEIRLTPRIRIFGETGDGFLLSQLSDGEQRLFSIFVDIARQLSLQPNGNECFTTVPAIILIDEIDLHLHPKWQRLIVSGLKNLFPRCQFIATTHSPFVIQSLRPGELIELDSKKFGEYADKSIEDIAETVMGIDLPQKSERYRRMMAAAEKYFRIVRDQNANPLNVQNSEQELNELAMPFSDDAAFQALLKLERELQRGGEN